jgi:hypothetical protein
MCDSTRFHALPDRPGYARYDIDLASPELPCGAAWLVNCLLELGIPAWKPWGLDDRAHWQLLDDGRYRYVGGDNGWSRVLPALRDGRTFAFRTGRCARVHHVWPDVYPAAPYRLLFVRDPCDALYSAWRRRAAPDDLDFRGFCTSGYFHYPLSWLDYLRLFLRVWRRAAERDRVKIVRFEDYRRDAAATLADVVAWLGLDVTAAALAHAVEASSVALARAEDRRLLGLGVVDRPLVRGAPPGECAREVDAATHAWLRSHFADSCVWLGYPLAPTLARPRQGPPPGDLHAALLSALRQADIPVDATGWLSTTLHDALADIEPVPHSAA